MRYLMLFFATATWAQNVHVVEAVSNVAVTVYIVSQLVVTAEERNVKSVTSAKLQKMILIKLKTLMMAPVTIWQLIFQLLTYLGMCNG